jgi:hypothetical protein
MKKIYILISLTLMLMATPLTEEKVMELFDAIKQSEYSWVVSQWDNEMKIKTQTRSSGRKSLWDEDEDPIDEKDNSALYPKDHPVGI